MESATTMKTTCIVTRRTSSSWNSAQAELYQRVVHPEGSHVPSQRVAKDETVTDAMTPNTLTTKKMISTTIAVDQRRAPSERGGTDGAPGICLSLSCVRAERER